MLGVIVTVRITFRKEQTDDEELKDVECAMIDVFFNYEQTAGQVCTHVHFAYTNVHNFLRVAASVQCAQSAQSAHRK